jgi:N-methylhydantoinase A
MIRIGIDCGVTFTDIVVVDEQKVSVRKIPSSPSDPMQSILKGLQKLVKEGEECILRHGTSLPAALLAKKNLKCILITNEGFEDILEIGRESRPETFSFDPIENEPLIPEKNRLGIKERCAADGNQLVPLEPKELDRIKGLIKKAKPDAVAVSLLHSYANPESELKIKEYLGDLKIPLFLSHQILPEFREYDRTCATVINTCIQPEMDKYFSSLEKLDTPKVKMLEIMQSNGGVAPLNISREEPVRTLEAGPAGGVAEALRTAKQTGLKKIAAFEIGGTSADICLCEGKMPSTRDREVQQLPVALQSVDISRIGPGAGAVAWVDEDGLLKVGPNSAGSEPGPMCYGKGDLVTLCDAHVFLNRIDPDNLLGGEMILQTDKIPAALGKLAEEMNKKGGNKPEIEEIAEGIIRIANAEMSKEIRVFAQKKGCNPADLALIAYGGAGPLHACEIAGSLGISKIMVPPHPGVLSTIGILNADVIEDTARTVLFKSDIPRVSTSIVKNFRELKDIVREKLKGDGEEAPKIEFEEYVDIRYPGQASELKIPYSRNFIQAFHKEHHYIYGHSDPSLSVEIVTVRVRGRIRNTEPDTQKQRLRGKNPPGKALLQERSVYFAGEHIPTSYFLRSLLCPGNRIVGPAIIMEYSSTTMIPAGFEAQIDPWENIVLEKISS